MPYSLISARTDCKEQGARRGEQAAHARPPHIFTLGLVCVLCVCLFREATALRRACVAKWRESELSGREGGVPWRACRQSAAGRRAGRRGRARPCPRGPPAAAAPSPGCRPGTRPNISESHSEISTRVPFCIATSYMVSCRCEVLTSRGAISWPRVQDTPVRF